MAILMRLKMEPKEQASTYSRFRVVSEEDQYKYDLTRGGSRTAATSKMERFVMECWKPLTILTKRSTLDVTVVLDPPLLTPDVAKYARVKEADLIKNVLIKNPVLESTNHVESLDGFVKDILEN